jgi:hypothetical protein
MKLTMIKIEANFLLNDREVFVDYIPKFRLGRYKEEGQDIIYYLVGWLCFSSYGADCL